MVERAKELVQATRPKRHQKKPQQPGNSAVEAEKDKAPGCVL